MNPYLSDRVKKTLLPSKPLEDENEFNQLGVEIFKEIGDLIISISSGFKVDKQGVEIPYSKEEAVIIGSLVRLGKLCIGFIEQYAQARLETTMIMFRCLAETFINLKYFLKYADEHTLRHYIKHSLQTERQVLEILKSNTSDKDVLEPIEERIIHSIKKAFDDADFSENELNKSSKWEKKLKSRLSDIIDPQAYALIYGTASHSIHGNWQDLILYNLEKKDGGFYPNSDWSMPRLQILSCAIFFCCDGLQSYVNRLLPNDENKDELLKVILDIAERAYSLDRMHEKFIQKKMNTATNIV